MREMIVNMALKRIADFHGHVCPDLVLGCKLCEFIQQLLPPNEPASGVAAIIAENATSALDAIQITLGITLGNQRLKVVDMGKHNYTVVPKTVATGFRLMLKPLDCGNEVVYQRLSGKMLENSMVMDEAAQLQLLLEERVRYLLRQPPEDLFTVRPVEIATQIPEVPSVYLTCCQCGEQVLASHAVEREDEIYCVSCLQRISVACRHRRLH